MKRLVLLSLLGLLNAIGCQTHSQLSEASTVPSVDSVNTNSVNSVAKPRFLVKTHFGAIITRSRIIADENTNYICQVEVVNDTTKSVRVVELIDYQDGGGMMNTYNLRRSVKQLGKLKIQLLPGKSTIKSFRINASYVNPVVAKIFYQDGSVQHTMYDVVGDATNWLDYSQKQARHIKTKSGHVQSYQPRDAVQDYYDKQQENQQKFHQTEVNTEN